MAKPMAGAAGKSIVPAVMPAELMNLITKIEFTRPNNKEPVSPMNIFAGEKL